MVISRRHRSNMQQQQQFKNLCIDLISNVLKFKKKKKRNLILNKFCPPLFLSIGFTILGLCVCVNT
ncbi:hypothetical protein BpHYR1_032709 [Brachionus plicatilis]|uniref:Transmembrane protein n=1 Tax=Brachionus plicatilis TaxID=10195 RepID=A0A3M7Q3G9_BRAPC|nr:hypothetical protein BpHYR1_032709 [Brachionus plicatilis]